MLKNNKEREEYILNENNWEIIEKTNIITIRKLKGTNFIKLYFKMNNQWYGEHEVCVGTYLLTIDGLLDNVYSYTINQIVKELQRLN